MTSNLSFSDRRFFKISPPENSLTFIQSAFFANTENNAASCFLAMAAGIIDNFLNHAKMKKDFINKMMLSHFRCFPQHRPTIPGLISNSERMQEVIKQVPVAELVGALAYTLRQLAVDEFCAQPTQYWHVFTSGQTPLTPQVLRNPATRINESALAALASALDLSVDVKVTAPGQELPLRRKYHAVGATFKIFLQLHDQCYAPLVNHAQYFARLKTHPVNGPTPLRSSAMAEQEIEQILHSINENNQHVLTDFARTKHQLEAMVNAGELNKNDLFTLYNSGITCLAAVENEINYAKTAQGSERFFTTMREALHKPETAISSAYSYDAYIIDGLIEAIARAVSLGALNLDEVFLQIEQQDRKGLTLLIPTINP